MQFVITNPGELKGRSPGTYTTRVESVEFVHGELVVNVTFTGRVTSDGAFDCLFPLTIDENYEAEVTQDVLGS